MFATSCPRLLAPPVRSQIATWHGVLVQRLQLPRKVSKSRKPRRQGAVFVAINQHGEVFVERRPDKGLLGGMTAFPSSGWARVCQPLPDTQNSTDAAPFAAEWHQLQPPIRHVFTHFVLDMTIFVARVHTPLPVSPKGWWQWPKPSQLPSLMRKIWNQVEQNWIV